MPEDELGNGYEYLIKKFADDSGHTAQEFYTNRTLVHLMAQMLEPQPGESIYDPTCGTGGMLISALAEVKRRGGEHRTLGLYGQELNHITAAIARMNLVLHGVEDFDIARGNTLAAPAFVEGDRLRTFDVVLANPPYSIKKWNREAWADRPVGPQLPRHAAAGPRRLRLLPAHPEEPGPEDRALRDPVSARRAVPQRGGRDAAQAGRSRPGRVRARPGPEPLLQLADGGLRRRLPDARSRRRGRGKVLFIDAVNEVARERAQSFLKPEHQQRILAAYQAFADEPGFADGRDRRRCARERRQPVDSALREAGAPTQTVGRRRRHLAAAWAAFDAERARLLAARWTRWSTCSRRRR